MPTLTNRLRPARDLTRDAARSVTRTGDAIAERADEVATAVASGAETMAERVGDVASALGDQLNGIASEVEHSLREAKAQVADGTALDDVVQRLERRWPGTDTSRYDRAFERGYARGRSGRLMVGAVVGAAAAGAGLYLFDPEHGTHRREALAIRLRGLADQGRRFVDGQRAAMEAQSTSRTPSLGELEPVGVPVESGVDTAPPDLRTPVAAGSIAVDELEAERGDWHRELER